MPSWFSWKNNLALGIPTLITVALAVSVTQDQGWAAGSLWGTAFGFAFIWGAVNWFNARAK